MIRASLPPQLQSDLSLQPDCFQKQKPSRRGEPSDGQRNCTRSQPVLSKSIQRKIPTLNADNLGHREVADNQLRSAPTMQRLPNINILQFSTRHTPCVTRQQQVLEGRGSQPKKATQFGRRPRNCERAYSNLHPTKLTDYSTTLQCNCGFPATVHLTSLDLGTVAGNL